MDTESGLWRSVSCETQQPYVCKKPLNKTVSLPGAFLAFSSVQISLWSPVNTCQTPILTFPSPDTANVFPIPRTHAGAWGAVLEDPEAWLPSHSSVIDELQVNERLSQRTEQNDMPIILILWNYVFVQTKTRIWQWLFECIYMWLLSLFLCHTELSHTNNECHLEPKLLHYQLASMRVIEPKFYQFALKKNYNVLYYLFLMFVFTSQPQFPLSC